MLEQFNILDWIMLAIAVFFMIRALIKGFLRELGSLVALLLAIWGSFAFYQPVADFLRRVVGKQDFWWETMAFGLCFFGIYLFIIFVAGRIAKVLHKNPLSLFDRLLGGVLGLLKGALLCFLLLNLILVLQPMTRFFDNEYVREDVMTKSYLVPLVLQGGHFALSLVPDKLIPDWRGNNKLYGPLTPTNPAQPAAPAR